MISDMELRKWARATCPHPKPQAMARELILARPVVEAVRAFFRAGKELPLADALAAHDAAVQGEG